MTTSDDLARPQSEPKLDVAVQIVLRPLKLVYGLSPEYVIDSFPATLGRHSANDIELPFDSISRYHSRIELFEGEPRLVDLHSSNGTWVNGQRVQMSKVQDNDAVAFGSLEFSVSVYVGDRTSDISGGREPTSVHFILHDSLDQTVYQTELPDESSHASGIDDEITSEDQLKRAKEQLVTLYRLQDVLRATSDEDKLLHGVLALLFDVLPVDRGVILTRDERDESVFRPIAIKTKVGLTGQKIGISRTILQRCMRERLAVLTRDAPSDSRFKEAESVIAGSMRSVMCVPLISMRHIFGFMHLDTTDAVRSFTHDDLAFLASVGTEVATHMHNLRMLNEKITQERMAAIGQTITGMAHNIKNILLLSQGGIEVMDKRLHSKNYDVLDETWAVVRRGLDRINGLVQEMLDYSRARTVERTRTDVCAFLTELCEPFAEELSKREIELVLDLPDDDPRMMLDIDGLEKALANLIVNSMEAAESSDGHIWVRARVEAGGDLRLEVEDDAGGIPDEVLPRIFVPFFSTKGSKGSGLGLAMTRKFIEDMGGTIEVNTKPGSGTRFVMHISAHGPSRSEPTQHDGADKGLAI
jgi:two-component system, NtrC family, sensor kinase